jgi:peptidyl-prolyl cis-trans isomerase NIMA-interacting 4
MAKGKQDNKSGGKGSDSGKGKKVEGKGGASEDKTSGGKVKGAQSINVRHILVGTAMSTTWLHSY